MASKFKKLIYINKLKIKSLQSAMQIKLRARTSGKSKPRKINLL
ncbi:uncharacterized protein METZ01_LOCUS457399 [marine metagenome]|uniref:Uncharacterized protein n=1 Tax=marine metagenome TaxID=408172 RepID=A0A383ABI8_9ZZZZ